MLTPKFKPGGPGEADATLRELDATIYIAHNSPDPLAGRVELVSAGAFRTLGYKAEEFIQDPGLWHRIIHPDDMPSVVERKEEIWRLREPRTSIYRLRHAVSGEYRWIEDSAVPLSDDQGNVIAAAGVIRDITPLEQVGHKRRERKVHLEALIEAFPDAVLVADDAGLILQCNAAAERMLGWTSGELAGRAVEVLLPERCRSAHVHQRGEYAKAPKARSMGAYELKALRKNGTEVPVDIILGVIPDMEGNLVMALIRDMTEQQAPQQRLGLLASIVEHSVDSIIGTDLEGMIVSWNRSAERLFGYTEEEAMGRHIVMVYPRERQSECFDNLKKIARREHPPRYESRRARKDGSQFDASVIISPIEDGKGKLLGISSISRDITERKRADAALQLAKRTAELASRAKSEFLANMSHEIRTPLNGILGLTDVVLDSELDEEQRENLTLVKYSANSLLTILSDILEIAKIQAGRYILQPKQFWMRDLIDSVMREFQEAAQAKHLSLTLHILPNVPSVLLGDSNCLRQVLSNIISNAIKFTSAGEVAVLVEASPKDRGSLTFSVRDTGTGVPLDRQQTIFELFSQVDNSLRRKFGGTGLGLAICAELADLMGGRIWVDSDGHTGSTFHLAVHLEVLDERPVNTVAGQEMGAIAPELGAHEQPQMKALRPFAPLPMEIEILDESEAGLEIRAGGAGGNRP